MAHPKLQLGDTAIDEPEAWAYRNRRASGAAKKIGREVKGKAVIPAYAVPKLGAGAQSLGKQPVICERTRLDRWWRAIQANEATVDASIASLPESGNWTDPELLRVQDGDA